MRRTEVKIIKLNPQAVIPAYGSSCAAGADLYACLEDTVTIAPGKTLMIPTGLALEIPENYAGLVYARSGLASKKGLAPANKVGVIDSDYRGELIIALFNHGTQVQTVSPGERIAQLVITPVLACDFIETQTLSDTARGSGGFGSTGNK
jgi:dUTP pyrophosphatase